MEFFVYLRIKRRKFISYQNIYLNCLVLEKKLLYIFEFYYYKILLKFNSLSDNIINCGC